MSNESVGSRRLRWISSKRISSRILARAMHLPPRRARPAKEAVDVVDPVVGEGALEMLGGGLAPAPVVGVQP